VTSDKAVVVQVKIRAGEKAIMDRAVLNRLYDCWARERDKEIDFRVDRANNSRKTKSRNQAGPISHGWG
jgi:hypothetical protein